MTLNKRRMAALTAMICCLILLAACTSLPTATLLPTATPTPTPVSTATPTDEVDWSNPANWPDPCSPPEEYIAVDGASTSYVVTFVDLNGNGQMDEDEPGLPGVEVQSLYSMGSPKTDDNGETGVSGFYPGCACACWQGDTLWVTVPDGFEATTPTEFDLTDNEVTYYFGFKAISTQVLASSDEPVWSLRFMDADFKVHQFHYDEARSLLLLKIDRQTGSDRGQVLSKIFTLSEALRTEGVAIRELVLMLGPTYDRRTCPMDEVSKQLITVSALDIFQNTCRADGE